MADNIISQVLEGYILYWLMAGFFAVGIILRMALLRVYKGLLRSAEEFATTDKTWTKQLRSRFETLYRLKIGINSVKAFVERHVAQKKVMGIFLTTWERICRQSILLSVLFGSIGSILCIITQRNRMEAVLYACLGVWLSMLSMMADDLAGFADKRRKLESIMYDYLENILKIRLERENEPGSESFVKQRELLAAAKEPDSKAVKKKARQEAKAQKKAQRRKAAQQKKRARREKSFAKQCRRAEKKKQKLEAKLHGDVTYAQERKKELLAEKQSMQSKNAVEEAAAVKESPFGDTQQQSGETVQSSRTDEKTRKATECIEESLIEDVLKEFLT